MAIYKTINANTQPEKTKRPLNSTDTTKVKQIVANFVTYFKSEHS